MEALLVPTRVYRVWSVWPLNTSFHLPKDGAPLPSLAPSGTVAGTDLAFPPTKSGPQEAEDDKYEG